MDGQRFHMIMIRRNKMNKEQLQQDIDAMREKLAEMELKLEKKYFIPEVGEKYWFINYYGNAELIRNVDTSVISHNITVGNCYRTKEEAVKAVAKQQAYVRIVRAVQKFDDAVNTQNSSPVWQGLDAKEIASIPLNEYTVQTVEKMLKEKNT
jgi:hypothetical protein